MSRDRRLMRVRVADVERYVDNAGMRDVTRIDD